MTTNKNDAATLTDEQVDGAPMVSLLDNGRSVAVRTFASVLVAGGCLALTACSNPTGPTPVGTAAPAVTTTAPVTAVTAVTADPEIPVPDVPEIPELPDLDLPVPDVPDVPDVPADLGEPVEEPDDADEPAEADGPGEPVDADDIEIPNELPELELPEIPQLEIPAPADPFDVSPNSSSVSAASGTTTFTMSSTIGWSVVDDAAWLTATKIDGSTISVSYDANLLLSSRTANIKASGTGAEETVTVTQLCLFGCGL